MKRLTDFVILAVLSCSPSAAWSEAESRACSIDDPSTFENWRNWASVTSRPKVSPGHSGNWVGVYVDELAEATYLAAASPYPECAKIVKPVYTDETGQQVRKLTAMVKMPAGYDPGNGDWWYASYDASGTKMGENGKLGGCIACHKQAAETDYLFSREVLEAVKK